MTSIMQNNNRQQLSATPGGGAGLPQVVPSGTLLNKRSLNSEVRKKELMKITIENQNILKRLQDKTSNYSVHRWEEQFRETEKRMKSMCEYPFALFTEQGVRSESRGAAAGKF